MDVNSHLENRHDPRAVAASFAAQLLVATRLQDVVDTILPPSEVLPEMFHAETIVILTGWISPRQSKDICKPCKFLDRRDPSKKKCKKSCKYDAEKSSSSGSCDSES